MKFARVESFRHARVLRVASALLTLAALSGARNLFAGEITFAQRVEAQRAIERVYYTHRTGAARPFEDEVPEALLEKKVRAYLAKSVALEEVWKTPLTAAMLQAEVRRMVAASRLPDRLRELRAALGNDDRLFAETVARETLVDRLCRRFLASDTRMETRDWDAWWAASAPRFNPMRAHTVIDGLPAPPAIDWGASAQAAPIPADASACVLQDLWAGGHTGYFPHQAAVPPMVWTGSELIAWGWSASSDDCWLISAKGDRYDPATDTWRPTQTVGAPSARCGHTAIWTGSEMIVWGGRPSSSAGANNTNTGGRYDPVADAWTPTSTLNAPPATYDHGAVWTGTMMIVWGGGNPNSGPVTNTGGRYHPLTDTWEPTSSINAPSPRGPVVATWTGREVLIWGAATGPGGRYDPDADTWATMSTVNQPTPNRYAFSAVWTGTKMVVWGGARNSGQILVPGGGLYDPGTDTWAPMSSVGAPSDRYANAFVWTGTEMIVWGGTDSMGNPQNVGGRYDPATDTWQPMSAVNSPEVARPAGAIWTGDQMIAFANRYDSSANGGRYSPATDSWTPTFFPADWPEPVAQPAGVWTGSEWIVWNGPYPKNGRYDPATDTWRALSATGAPSPRTDGTLVWIGQRMVVWGGTSEGMPLDTGGRYFPISDEWSTMPEDYIPLARSGYSSIVAGPNMIIWGGQGASGMLNDGALYDPGFNTWTPIPPDGAPAPRAHHTAVWTGDRMVVWGGDVGGGTATDSGGVYDPSANGGLGGWTATSMTGAPGARIGHTTVWTGSRMIVWGGDLAGGAATDTGGLYDPAADAWSPTATAGAPAPRDGHSAVWTGSRMIVWGGSSLAGESLTVYGSGGVYDPLANTWTPTTMTGAPSPRFHHAAAWTGQTMLVWGGSAGLNGFQVPIEVQDSSMRWYGNALLGPLADLDGDGVLSCQDCDDRNAGVWSPPGEVTGLLFGDEVTMSWSPPASAGAATVEYDLLRSDVASGFQTQGECVASGLAVTTATDSDTPLLGGGFFYLVRARNACPGGLGSLGTDSSGVLRLAATCP